MLRQANDQNDAARLAEGVHKMKGSCANLGAVRAAELCGELERCGRDRELAATASVFEQIESEIATVAVTLQAQRAR